MRNLRSKRVLALLLAGFLIFDEPAVGNVFAQETDSGEGSEAEEGITLDYEGDITVAYGDTANLEVRAESTSGTTLTYQWSCYNEEEGTWVEIEGETESSYSVIGDENAAKEYMCTVSDGLSSRSANIYLTLDTGLTLDYEGNITVTYGDTANLEVRAESALGKTLTYQWSYYNEEEWNWVEIEGATENSYSITGDENTAEQYRCTVSDGIVSKEAYIYIAMDTGLTLDYEEELTVTYGDTATLEVRAESALGKTLTYQWFYQNKEEGTWVEIEGEAESSYSITGDENMEYLYRCTVSDGIVSQEAYFYPTLSTGLTLDYEMIITVIYGDTANLEVRAESALGRTLTYQWSCYNEEKGNWVELEGATESSYPITGDENIANQYKCTVSDGIASQEAYFYPNLDTGLTLDYEEDITVTYGETANLEVHAESALGKVLTYQWSCYSEEEWNWVEIEGETESSYSVIGDENAAKEYMCTVSDGLSSKCAEFYLTLDTGIKIDQGGNTNLKAAYGETAFFEVRAESLQGRTLTYQWYYWDEEEGDYLVIEDAADSTYSVTADENAAREYQCVVSDGIKSKSKCFELEVELFSLDCEEQRPVVKYGETVELKVIAKTYIQGQALAYQWYYFDEDAGDMDEGMAIEGATESTYTITADEKMGTRYWCEVSDGASRKGIYFWPEIDIGFNIIEYHRPAVKYGETADMTVSVESMWGELPVYQWYYWDTEKNEYIAIAGATRSTYSVKATKRVSYKCRVSNGVGSKEAMFYLVIDTGFSVEDEDDLLDVVYGEKVDMKVNAVSTRPLTYQWSYWDEENGDYIVIEGETGSTYSVTVDENTSDMYRCYISDGINSSEKFFTIDQGDFLLNRTNRLSAAYGEQVEMKAEAKGQEGETFTYQWYYWDDEECDYRVILGATESSYSVTADENAKEEYRCMVTNGTESKDATFLLKIGTGYTVKNEQNLTVLYGEKADMKVDATSQRPLTYKWYYWNKKMYDYELIPDAEDNVWSVKADEKAPTEYRCTVSDGIHSENVYFYISIETLSVAYEEELSVAYEETAVMQVSAESLIGKVLTYQWLYYDKEKEMYRVIDGAVGSAYSVKADGNIAEKYMCVIFDGSERKRADFHLTVVPKAKIDINKACTAALSFTSAEYTGTEIKPAVTVSCGTQVLKAGTDYTVSYTDNIKVGTAKVTITGKGDYTGTIEKTFTIAAKQEDTKPNPVTKQSIEKAVVTLSKTSCSYNGKQQKPSVKSVKLGSTVLKNGTDYSVSYKNNKNIGKATVTITGKGSYTGTVTKTFTISAKKGATFTVGSYKYKITGSSAVSFAGLKSSKTTKVAIPKTVKIGGKSFQVTSIADKALQNMKVTSVKIGTNVTAIGKEAFKNCKKLGTITIQSTKLKTVGKNAFKGIKTTAKIKVPSKKLTAYKKLLKGKGQSKKVQIKK